MKKILLSWLNTDNKVNIEDNKNSILQLLKQSNFIELSVKEQIDLFKSVESEFCDQLAKQNIDAEITIEEIEKFSRAKVERGEYQKR